jgi:hypothetical protein
MCEVEENKEKHKRKCKRDEAREKQKKKRKEISTREKDKNKKPPPFFPERLNETKSFQPVKTPVGFPSDS